MAHTPSDWVLSDAKIVAPEEVSRILARCKELGEFDPYWSEVVYDWLVVAFNTGWRVSEVAHLEKSDILPHRVLITRRKKRRLHPEPVEVMPAVHEILRRRAAAVEQGFLFPGRQAPCFIYRQSKKNGASVEQVCVGGHASLRNIQRRFRLLIEDLDLYQYGRGIHVGRHYSITEIYRLTKDLRKAQVFAGHSSSAITERYAHVVDLADTLAQMKVML